MRSMQIRLATINDLSSIVKIYNQAIINRQTGDLSELTANDRKDWFSQHDNDNFPIFVAEENGEIIGWLSLSKYRSGRNAFIHCAEISYYVDMQNTGKGVGKKLFHHCLDYLGNKEITTLIAIILGSNTKSINFTGKFGFEVWGILPGVAMIDGQTIDHIYMGKKIK